MRNLKHNQYVTIPDWFTSNPVVQSETTTSIVQPIISSGGSSSEVGDLTIYNKFAIETQVVDKEALTITGYALVAVSYDELNVGDLVENTQWSTTDYISIAANTQMVINSTKDTNYGIVFYDYNRAAEKASVFEDVTEFPTTITVPDNVYYFRISCLTTYDAFEIEYKVGRAYTAEELLIAQLNTSDFTQTNENIPDGIVSQTISLSNLGLLVENPMYLHTDTKNIIRLSLNYEELPGADVGDMFVWDKKYAAFGYDPKTETAYSYTNGILDLQLDAYGNPLLDEEGNTIPLSVSDTDKWMYDEEATDKWIIKSTKQRLSLLEGLMEFDSDLDSFLFHKNIVTTGGVTLYADLGDVNTADIYDGLSLDNLTITWVYDSEGKNKVLTAISNLDVDNKFVSREEWNTFIGDGNDLDNLINTWTELKNFLIGMDDDINLLDFFDNYAHKQKNEVIEGIYNFTKGLRVNGQYLQYDAEKNVWKFEGNIAATGGVTMYYQDEFEPDPTLLDQLIVSAPLYKEDGILKVDVDSIIGGGISNIYYGDQVAKQFVTGLGLADDGHSIVVNRRSLVKDDIPDLSDLYVNRTTDLTVAGWKNFTTGIQFNDLSMYYLKENVVFLDANLVVSGGVTMYGVDSDTDVPNLIDAIPPAGYGTAGLASFNSELFTVDENGFVSLIESSKDYLDYKLNLNIAGITYLYDGSQEITAAVNYTTLGLDDRYLRIDNIIPTLQKNNFHQIIAVSSESECTGSDILYIITS